MAIDWMIQNPAKVKQTDRDEVVRSAISISKLGLRDDESRLVNFIKKLVPKSDSEYLARCADLCGEMGHRQALKQLVDVMAERQQNQAG